MKNTLSIHVLNRTSRRCIPPLASRLSTGPESTPASRLCVITPQRCILSVGAWLHRVVEGYFRYHAVPTNLYRLDGFRTEVCRAWRHALRQRSQRTRMNWDRFNRTVLQYIPRCRKLHPYPEERFFASRTLGKSRMR